MSEKIKISILAANPENTDFLALNEEFRRIQGLQRSSPFRDQFEVTYHPELRANELQEIVLDAQSKPHIIHFCGHGKSSGLVLTDDSGKKSHIVTKDVLADLFKLCKPDLQAVVLNACYSEDDADAIVAQVPFFVGMNDAIKDDAAILFSIGFYTVIFNQATLDIKKAYDAGINKMGIANTPANERLKPVLRRPPFTSNYKQDIFVCFSEADKDWAEGFAETLKEQLQKQLCPDGNLVVRACSDLENIEYSAVVLLVVSHAFVQIAPSNLKSLERLVNRNHPIYLIEIQPCFLPSVLERLKCYEFSYKSDNGGLVLLRDTPYSKKLNELVNELKNKLIKLKPLHKTPKIEKITPPPVTLSLPKIPTSSVDEKTDKPFYYKKWVIVFSAVGLGAFGFLQIGKTPTPPPVQEPVATTCAYCPEMVSIPAGSFSMGSNDYDSEKPIHTVNIKRFEMGKYEVTQGQWKAVIGENPSHFNQCGDDCPVENVSWDDIQEYLKKLNKLNEKKGIIYRLPTEAEWEYVCRGGKQEKYCGSDDIDKVAVYGKTQTQRVGGKAANGFGLYDMSGNVWEWVQDWYHDNYNGAPDDGSAWMAGGEQKYRVLRGGSWLGNTVSTRAANRNINSPENRFSNSGFRVARTVP